MAVYPKVNEKLSATSYAFTSFKMLKESVLGKHFFVGGTGVYQCF